MLTPDQFTDEIARRVIEAVSATAAAKGGKLTKSDRDRIRLGAVLGSAATFELISEQGASTTTASECPACGLVDDHMGGCPESGTAPQPGAPG